MHLNECAYSVLEVFISVLILALLIGVSIPNLHNLQSGSLLKRETRQLESLLERLQLKSIQGEEDIALHIATNSYKALKPNGHLIESHALKAPIHFSAPRAISFYSSGVTTPTTLEIKGSGSSCTITISLRGRINNSC